MYDALLAFIAAAVADGTVQHNVDRTVTPAKGDPVMLWLCFGRGYFAKDKVLVYYGDTDPVECTPEEAAACYIQGRKPRPIPDKEIP